ncbi:MAG: tail fiber domain-containing protein [Acidobacteriota bacterium]
MKVRRTAGFLLLALLLGFLPPPALSQQMTVSTHHVAWRGDVLEEYELRVAGPGDVFWRAHFQAGEPIELFVEDLEKSILERPLELAAGTTSLLGDGHYNWELRPLGNPSDVQRGQVSVKGGRFVGPRPGLERIRSADQVIGDDLIAERACIGPDCIDGEAFGTDELKIKAPGPSLFFESSTSNNWRLRTDASTGQFSLNSKLTVDPTSPASLHLTDSGLGINTSTPEGTLHILGSTSANLVLEGSFGPRWEFVSTNVASSLWLRERPGGTNFLDIMSGSNASIFFDQESLGRLSFGEGDAISLSSGRPRTVLEVRGTFESDTYAAFGTEPESFNVGLSGRSFGQGSGFLNIRPNPRAVAPNPSIRFLVANRPAMILDNEGYLGLSSSANFNPQHPIELESGAHVTAGGVWSNASSRALKGGIEPLGAAAAVATLEGLEPVLFHYLAEPNEESLGFIAEDVPEAVAHGDRTSLSTMDLVAVLTKVVQLQERRLDLQAEELTQLRLEVAALKDSARP